MDVELVIFSLQQFVIFIQVKRKLLRNIKDIKLIPHENHENRVIFNKQN